MVIKLGKTTWKAPGDPKIVLSSSLVNMNHTAKSITAINFIHRYARTNKMIIINTVNVINGLYLVYDTS